MNRKIFAALPAAGILALGACDGGTQDAHHATTDEPNPPATTQGAVPPETPPQASVFRVTKATVTYITSKDVPKDTRELDPGAFPAGARVAAVTFTYRNNGSQTITALGKVLYDTQGRTFEGPNGFFLPSKNVNGNVVPGGVGRDTVYLAVGNAKIAAIGVGGYDSSGAEDESLGYAIKHTS